MKFHKQERVRKVVLRERSQKDNGWWMSVSHVGNKLVIIKIGFVAVAIFPPWKNKSYFVTHFFTFSSGKEN